jgi:hypothetical protein
VEASRICFICTKCLLGAHPHTEWPMCSKWAYKGLKDRSRRDPRGHRNGQREFHVSKPCWDTEATLGGNKAARRIKTLTPWTPGPWKASLFLLTLWNPEASCCCQPEPQIYLGDIWQTKKWESSVMWYFPSHPWDKPALPPC